MAPFGRVRPEEARRAFKEQIGALVAAGADLVLTQPVFEPALVRDTLEAHRRHYGPLMVPVLVGVLPLYGNRHARFPHNEVPGITIPQAIHARISTAGDQAPQAGVSIAVEILGELSELVQGAYPMPPFNRYDMAAEIIESLPHRTPVRQRSN